MQAVYFRAVERGTQERGQPLDTPARAWAEDLAERLLLSKDPKAVQDGIEIIGSQRFTDRQDRLVQNSDCADRENRFAARGAVATGSHSNQCPQDRQRQIGHSHARHEQA